MFLNSNYLINFREKNLQSLAPCCAKHGCQNKYLLVAEFTVLPAFCYFHPTWNNKCNNVHEVWKKKKDNGLARSDFILRPIRIHLTNINNFVVYSAELLWYHLSYFLQPSTEVEMYSYEQNGPSGFMGDLWHLLEEKMNFT
jgi:hypothetical protein